VSWERYELRGFLGEGGMGRVYKAFDPLLKRPVALKFLRREDPELQQRLIREAQAQAKIRHPHVCEIYEVGEFQNHVYIAMQEIQGKNLKELQDGLALQQKVQIMMEVAGALHAGHRLGLIHRDVKPANILVEMNEDGALHPYILDFGLVRELEAPGNTITGVLVGTPYYMSPEQARGVRGGTDGRSDVYSLGATLYEILCGQAPFEGASGVDAILKLVQDEVPSIRKHNPQIPEDLESIVMKCLEKDPDRRYESARALSEDLERFLNGEPVRAKPAGWVYRVAKKARKNKALVGVTFVSLLIVLTFTVLGLRARWNAAQQALLAQQFGQEIERMDSTMRYAYLLPMHDIRREKQIVKRRMGMIEIQISKMGEIARGPGDYALGRGWMALHDYKKARILLEKAWNGNYRAPEVAYALGHTLGVLYRMELEEAEQMSGKQMRDFRKKQIEKEFRDRAIHYINESGGIWSESPAYVRGILAFYQKRYEDALRQSREAWSALPWLYEAKLLEGEIWTAKANAERDQGKKPEAFSHYLNAEKAYREAASRAASDNTIYEALCGLYADRMKLQIYQTGISPKQDFETGLKECVYATGVDPESEEALNKTATLYWRWGEFQFTSGENPHSSLQKAAEYADLALKWNPRSISAYLSKGLAYRILSEYEMEHGADPVPMLNEAIKNFRNCIKIDPNHFEAYHSLGNSFWTLGEYESGRGLDPRSNLDRANDNFRKVLEINPDYATAQHNIGVTYWSQAEYENFHGLDPTDSLKKAEAALRQSLKLIPDYSLAHSNLGGVRQSLGQYQWQMGLDPEQTMMGAITSFKKALEINPDYSYAYNNMADAYLVLADFRIDQGQDPLQWLVLADEAIAKAIETNPDYYEPFLIQARIDLARARDSIRKRVSPVFTFEPAHRAIEKARVLNPEEAQVYVTLQNLYRLQAEWAQIQGRVALPLIRAGLDAAEKALLYHPELAETLALRAILRLQQAKEDPQNAKALAEAASKDLQDAFRHNGNLKRLYGPFLQKAIQQGVVTVQ